MFLGVWNIIFLNISIFLPHLELRNHSIQFVVITNFVVISNPGIKRFGCISKLTYCQAAYQMFLESFCDLYATIVDPDQTTHRFTLVALRLVFRQLRSIIKLYRSPIWSRINGLFSLVIPRNKFCGYLLEPPRWDDCNKLAKHRQFLV